MKPSESRALIQRPDQYLAAQAKTLDERLAEVALPEGTEEIIAAGVTKKLIRDNVLGLFKVGQVVSAVLGWNENIDKEIREAKREHLLALYFHKNEQNSQAISTLKSFMCTGQGNTLFNKIIRILDDSPPDEELVAHLAAALKHIIDSDFVSLFEEHKYALSQIEQITPQALAILADNSSWPKMTLNEYQSTGTKVVSDWLYEFNQAYSVSKGIKEQRMQSRVRYSISELFNRRIIEAHLADEGMAVCRVTDIGGLILPYLNR